MGVLDPDYKRILCCFKKALRDIEFCEAKIASQPLYTTPEQFGSGFLDSFNQLPRSVSY